MDNGIIDRLAEKRTSVVWPVYCAYESLCTVLSEAVEQATLLQRSVLVSFAQAIPVCEPLSLLAAGQKCHETSFFWEQPAEEKAVIGLGEVARIEASGPERFDAISEQWKHVLRDAIIHQLDAEQAITTQYHLQGPALFGSIAFADDGTQSALWQDLPNSLFVLPHLLLYLQGEEATLTVNLFVDATTDVEQTALGITTHILQLRAAVEYQAELSASFAPSTYLYEQPDSELPGDQDWIAAVQKTIERIQQGQYEKVVLARGVKCVQADEGEVFLDCVTLQRLRQSYPTSFIFALRQRDRSFIGATPERLASVSNGHLKTMALAGSARRGETEEEDSALGRELLQSQKNRQEHAFVVTMLHNALQQFCSNITIAPEPQLLKLHNVQHLQTPITGVLSDRHTLLDIIAKLHPTPAVGGLPHQDALDVIRTYGCLDRGWYAGPIGWFDACGDGEFAVALRCALVYKHTAVLFAGCGIVADSDPLHEYEETRLKLRAMLYGLSGRDHLDSDHTER